MRISEKNNITLYQFESPAFESVTTFVTTRHNITHTANPRGNFNLGLYCGDDTAQVEARLLQLCGALGIARTRLYYPRQVHGCKVLAIDSNFVALPHSEQLEALDGVDAIITNVPQVAIAVTTADCVPIVLFDPVHRAIAAIHAGWRGTAQNIVEHTVHTMSQLYATQPHEIHAGIGPCIGMEAYEVGDEVIEAMYRAGVDVDSVTVRNRNTHKMHIDLAATNADMLLRCGVELMNIEVCGICTHHNSANFYSVRALGNETGRFLTGVMMRDDSV